MVSQIVDTISFRVVWWFKHFGKGSSDSITSLLLNISERCIDPILVKEVKNDIWTTPKGGVLKFNVDGSARGSPGSAGIGGVLRDHNGKMFGSYSRHIRISDANSAEITTIHQACVLCASTLAVVGKEIQVVSDSKVVVSWVNSVGFESLQHINLIYEIRTILHFLGRTKVVFNLRSTNSFANSLVGGLSSECGKSGFGRLP